MWWGEHLSSVERAARTESPAAQLGQINVIKCANNMANLILLYYVYDLGMPTPKRGLVRRTQARAPLAVWLAPLRQLRVGTRHRVRLCARLVYQRPVGFTLIPCCTILHEHRHSVAFVCVGCSRAHATALLCARGRFNVPGANYASSLFHFTTYYIIIVPMEVPTWLRFFTIDTF